MKKRWPWLLVVLLLIPVGWGGWRVVWEMGRTAENWSAATSGCGVNCDFEFRHIWQPQSVECVFVHWHTHERDEPPECHFVEPGSWLVFDAEKLTPDGEIISAHYSLEGELHRESAVSPSAPRMRHLTPSQVQALVREAALYVQEQAKAGHLPLPEGWEYVE